MYGKTTIINTFWLMDLQIHSPMISHKKPLKILKDSLLYTRNGEQRTQVFWITNIFEPQNFPPQTQLSVLNIDYKQ